MKTSSKFRATNPPTKDLTDNQRIIRDYTSFGIYLEAIGDKTLSFHYFAGAYKKYNEDKDDFEMPSPFRFNTSMVRMAVAALMVWCFPFKKTLNS